MVDQWRSPRWFPATASGGWSEVDALLPNIAKLRRHSVIFPNYYVAATACTPSRATLLTGLYSQQTAMFRTQGLNTVAIPSLDPGFPTFATALSQWEYNVYWIGKWHLSDPAPAGPPPGANGPTDYGFTKAQVPNPQLNYPRDTNDASPNGLGNLGTEGDNPFPGDFPPVPAPPDHQPDNISDAPFPLLNDAAICDFFISTFLPNVAPSPTPWRATVSFVNPHDITSFPYAYDLATSSGPFFPPNPVPSQADLFPSYPAPPTGGTSPTGSQQQIDDQHVPPLPSLYNSSSKPPTDWNVLDNPATQPYNGGMGKPTLQAVFQAQINSTYGSVGGYNAANPSLSDTSNWLTFLNYYFWLQQCVDYHIGRVITALEASPYWGTTHILFHADHGEYAGSHWLKAKGGALYEEAINVPFYYSHPNQRTNYDSGPSTAVVNKYVCSSVDIFPFLFALALGNESWRNPYGQYYYLAGRESIADFIFGAAPIQRRVVTLTAGSQPVPYILHTTDEFPIACVPDPAHPGQYIGVQSHAIAFRTFDPSVALTTDVIPPYGTFQPYGGAKLGIYSFWPTPTVPPTKFSTRPDPNGAQQFEFYNYTANGLAETGNQYATDPLALIYPPAFASIKNAELYAQATSAGYPIDAYNQALANYFSGQGSPSCATGPGSNDAIIDMQS